MFYDKKDLSEMSDDEYDSIMCSFKVVLKKETNHYEELKDLPDELPEDRETALAYIDAIEKHRNDIIESCENLMPFMLTLNNRPEERFDKMLCVVSETFTTFMMTADEIERKMMVIHEKYVSLIQQN